MFGDEIKISVVVPVFNLENELERCVKSILAQTHSNLELLLVDDGSTDGSRVLISTLAKSDSRIMPIYQENMGVTMARLAGVRQANGEYIGFVDGDDEIDPDMYEFLLNNAIQYGADISHCGCRREYEDGRVNYFHNTGCLAKQDRPTGLKDLLDGSLVESSLWNKLFHKTLFHSLLHDGLMPADIRINEDLLMNYFLFQEAELSVFEDVCKYCYHVRDGSASRRPNNPHKLYDPIKVRTIMLEHCSEDMYPTVKRAYIDTCLNTYNGLITDNDPAFQEDQRKMRELMLCEKKEFGLLSRKHQVMIRMALSFPPLYRVLYRFYAKHIQENPYV